MTKPLAPLSVFLLTGQSNSLGTTNDEKDYWPGEHPADDATKFFWSNVDARNTEYPPTLYGDSASEMKPMQVQQGDHAANPVFWGPEIGFAQALQAAQRAEQLIIKASRGGGGNTFWSAEAYQKDANSGHMWGHLRNVLRQSLGPLVASGRPFRLVGLLYIQGESNSPSEAELADVRLEELIESLREFAATLLPNCTDEMHTLVGEIAASTSTAARELTTAKQSSLPSRRKDVSFITTRDLPLKADGIHFDRSGKLEIGRRLAKAFLARDSAPLK
jgi:hypothetical protein